MGNRYHEICDDLLLQSSMEFTLAVTQNFILVDNSSNDQEVSSQNSVNS